MYKVRIGRKGLLAAAKMEEGCDIGAGTIESVYKVFSGENYQERRKMHPIDHLDRMCKSAIKCRDKEVEDLTEDEKFSICFMAGVEIDWQRFDEISQSFNPITKNPCGIVKIEGKFQVYERKRDSCKDFLKYNLLHKDSLMGNLLIRELAGNLKIDWEVFVGQTIIIKKTESEEGSVISGVTQDGKILVLDFKINEEKGDI